MSLIDNILQFIIDIYVKILGTIGDFVVMPIINVFVNKIPNVASYLTYFTDFCSRIFNGVAFAKEVFFNVTGYPRALFFALVVFFFFKVTNMVLIRARRFVFNIYYLLRGSKGAIKIYREYGG